MLLKPTESSRRPTMVFLVIASRKIMLTVVLYGFCYLATPVIVFSQLDNYDTTQSNSNSNLDESMSKVVILTFDGGHKSQYINAKPVLDKYGFKATFYVVCEYTQKGGDTRMNWTEVRELHKQGHDIGSNTMNHYRLTDLPTEKIEYEVSVSEQCLLDHGINTTSFAYPYNSGASTSAVVNKVAEHYYLARSSGSPLMFLDCSQPRNEDNETSTIDLNSNLSNSQKPTDCRPYSQGQDDNNSMKTVHRYSITGWSHEEERKENEYNDSQMLQRFIEVVNSQSKYNQNGTINAIPIVIYQKVETDNKDNDFSAATSTELFDAEMKYLHDNGFIVLTISDLTYDQTTHTLQTRDNI
jgi:hypothetical protein